MDELYIIGKHGAGCIKIGNHTVFEGPNGFNGSRSFAEHPLGFTSDRDHLLGFFVPRHDRGLADHYPFIAHPDKGICRS